MHAWRVVWEVGSAPGADLIGMGGRVAVGAATAAGALVALALRLRGDSGKERGDLLWIALMAGWSAVWLRAHIPAFLTLKRQHAALFEAVRSGRCELAEGRVHVLRTQARSGHSSDDRVEVGGRRFELSYFRSSEGYKTTLARGGALREGREVRLCAADGVIARVEVRD